MSLNNELAVACIHCGFKTKTTLAAWSEGFPCNNCGNIVQRPGGNAPAPAPAPVPAATPVGQPPASDSISGLASQHVHDPLLHGSQVHTHEQIAPASAPAKKQILQPANPDISPQANMTLSGLDPNALDEVKEKFSALKTKLTQAQEIISRLKMDNQELINEKTQLELRMENSSGDADYIARKSEIELKVLKDQYRVSIEKLKTLQLEMDEIRHKAIRYETENDELTRQLALAKISGGDPAIGEENEGLKQKITAYETQLRTERSHKEELVEKMRARFEDAKATLAQLNEEKEQNQLKAEKLAKSLAQKETDLEDVNISLANLQKNKEEALMVKEQEFAQEKSSLINQNNDLQSELKKKQDELDDAVKNTQVVTDYSGIADEDLRFQTEQRAIENKVLEEKLLEMAKDLAETKVQNVELEKRCSELDNERSKKSKALRQLQQNVDGMIQKQRPQEEEGALDNLNKPKVEKAQTEVENFDDENSQSHESGTPGQSETELAPEVTAAPKTKVVEAQKSTSATSKKIIPKRKPAGSTSMNKTSLSKALNKKPSKSKPLMPKRKTALMKKKPPQTPGE
ncbi:MAG: hypothetical protein MK193_11245 [Lentisphaeria bacterium]|nr:hypothetical protein [Lentisphaeria bacterium]